MPELRFEVKGAVLANEPTPLVIAQLSISNSSAEETIESIRLRCQIQVEPARRRYSLAERPRFEALFGPAEQWVNAFRPLPCGNVEQLVPAFVSTTVTRLALPHELPLTVQHYVAALQEGDVPLLLLFTGTIFYQTENRVQIAPIPWDCEARYRMPLETWRQFAAATVPDAVSTAAHRAISEFVERSRRAARRTRT